MKLNSLVKMVVNEFVKDIEFGEFSSFSEMCSCYWWSSLDVKNEVRAIFQENNFWGMCDDGTEIEVEDCEEGCISYRKFIMMVYRELKKQNLY